MRITSVSFNFDPGSSGCTALTIQRDAFGPPIEAPEWQAGRPSKPVAYAVGGMSTDVLVQVTVEGGRPGATCKLVGHPTANRPDNVLGTAISGFELFDGTGRAGPIDCVLSNHQLDKASVGKYQAAWSWQAQSDSKWVKVGSTENEVYLTLDSPGSPWGHRGCSGRSIQQHPWVSALEVATEWAHGASNLEEAAAAITRAVNKVPNQTYNSQGTFGGGKCYNLALYLERVAGATYFSVNCTDCANAVTTLANVLGCRLVEGRFNISSGSPDNTFSIATTGTDPKKEGSWKPYAFGYHETAWRLPFGEKGGVYDACLHLNLNKGSGAPDPDLPTGMCYEAYNPLLIATSAAFDPPTRQRPLTLYANGPQR